jgi:hypothetical protein
LTEPYRKTTRTYLLVLGLFILFVPVIGLLNYAFLEQSREFEPVEKVVKFQLQNGGLYLSALHQTIHPYKLTLYQAVKPKIVVLGSSRVYQFRGRYFNVPFVNMGGSMQSCKDGEKVLKQIAASHKPEVILLNLDPWWFGRLGESLIDLDQSSGNPEFRLDLLFVPCEWLLGRKISLVKFCQTLMGREQNPFPTMGVFATVNREGFYRDGSLYDYGKVFGFNNNKNAAKFANEEDLIKRGLKVFAYDRTINTKRWEEFVALLNYAKTQNIQVITFFGPFPARVVDWIADQGENYAYIDELRARIPEVSVHHFDFFDPREFGSCDCEFLDGLHAGEITVSRMLRAMGQDPASGLGPYLDWPEVEESIRQFAGKAMIPLHSFGPQYKEIDFLELGCKKN